jgi:hypothetical protein
MGEIENTNGVKDLRKRILRDFFKFLKEKGAYTKYKRNIADCVIREWYRYETKEEKRKHWQETYQYGIQIRILSKGRYKLTYERCRELVNYAFTWSETPEKHQFWSKLSDEWTNIFSKNYRPYASVLDEKY